MLSDIVSMEKYTLENEFICTTKCIYDWYIKVTKEFVFVNSHIYY